MMLPTLKFTNDELLLLYGPLDQSAALNLSTHSYLAAENRDMI